MVKTILAIGGHIGDACLTAGGVMAANAVDGGKNYRSVENYLVVKIMV